MVGWCCAHCSASWSDPPAAGSVSEMLLVTFVLTRQRFVVARAIPAATLQKFDSTIKALKLTDSDAQQLFDFFHKVDEDGSGEVSLLEFFDYLDLKRTKFAKRAFGLFDEDGSGEIVRLALHCVALLTCGPTASHTVAVRCATQDFREFVVALWSYCKWTGSHAVHPPPPLSASCLPRATVCAHVLSVRRYIRQERTDDVCFRPVCQRRHMLLGSAAPQQVALTWFTLVRTHRADTTWTPAG